MNTSKNVLGGALLACSYSPLTGFYRTGCCETGPDDLGRHVVCVKVDAAFLDFSRRAGNDLFHAATRVPLCRAQAGRPLVPVRAALEGGARGRRGTAR